VGSFSGSGIVRAVIPRLWDDEQVPARNGAQAGRFRDVTMMSPLQGLKNTNIW